MRKKSILLDFTSLLDVIMILLFVVLANLHASSTAAVDKAAQEVATAQAESNFLRQENQALQDACTEIYDQAGENANVYASVIDRMTKVSILCETWENPDTHNAEVTMNLYVSEDGLGQKTQDTTYVIVHEQGLTYNQRKVLHARQTAELTKVLTTLLEGDESPLVWFMAQYAYEDPRMTQSDLAILKDAIENVEIGLQKPCYLEKINIS